MLEFHPCQSWSGIRCTDGRPERPALPLLAGIRASVARSWLCYQSDDEEDDGDQGARGSGDHSGIGQIGAADMIVAGNLGSGAETEADGHRTNDPTDDERINGPAAAAT